MTLSRACGLSGVSASSIDFIAASSSSSFFSFSSSTIDPPNPAIRTAPPERPGLVPDAREWAKRLCGTDAGIYVTRGERRYGDGLLRLQGPLHLRRSLDTDTEPPNVELDRT